MARRRRRKPQPIANRDSKVDAVHTWIASRHRDRSMDDVVCSPVDSFAMAVAIAKDHGELKRPGRAEHLVDALITYARQSPGDMAAIAGVLRAAMNARKHGDLGRDRF